MATTIKTQRLPKAERFVLHDVDWETYEAITDALGDRPGLRLTYDGETLEFMNTSAAHEYYKKLLGRLIETLCLVCNIPLRSGGSMTFKRQDLNRGMEPDECYWIANERAVRGKRQIDLLSDPPPDLALEIDISRSPVRRQPIYAALRVPELWRFNGRTLQVLLLQEDGRYRPADRSAAFPFLPIQELVRFLDFDDPMDETARMRQFVEWLREKGIAH